MRISGRSHNASQAWREEKEKGWVKVSFVSCLPDAEELEGEGGTGEGNKAKQGAEDAKNSQHVAEADCANEL